MPLDDLSPPIALPAVAGERAPIARITGCPRCGSVCPFLDDCPVCLGETRCARCFFGPRVAEPALMPISPYPWSAPPVIQREEAVQRSNKRVALD